MDNGPFKNDSTNYGWGGDASYEEFKKAADAAKFNKNLKVSQYRGTPQFGIDYIAKDKVNRKYFPVAHFAPEDQKGYTLQPRLYTGFVDGDDKWVDENVPSEGSTELIHDYGYRQDYGYRLTENERKNLERYLQENNIFSYKKGNKIKLIKRS